MSKLVPPEIPTLIRISAATAVASWPLLLFSSLYAPLGIVAVVSACTALGTLVQQLLRDLL